MDRSKISAERVEQLVDNCVANQAIEGLTCTEEDKESMRRIITGEATLRAELDAVIAKYKEQQALITKKQADA